MSPPARTATRRWSSRRATSPASTRSIASAARRRSRRSPTARETIPRVDKIVGPGNIYVATAKRLVLRPGRHRLDRRAERGADRRRRLAPTPALVAADLLAQAEHDPLAAAVCVTTDRAARGARRARRSTSSSRRCRGARSPRRALAALRRHRRRALDRGGRRARQPARARAPRAARAPTRRAGRGACGTPARSSSAPDAPEAFGDYLAGPNHVLPDRRHGALRVAARRLRLRQADEPHRGRAGGRSRASGRPSRGSPRLEGLDAHGRAVERAARRAWEDAEMRHSRLAALRARPGGRTGDRSRARTKETDITLDARRSTAAAATRSRPACPSSTTCSSSSRGTALRPDGARRAATSRSTTTTRSRTSGLVARPGASARRSATRRASAASARPRAARRGARASGRRPLGPARSSSTTCAIEAGEDRQLRRRADPRLPARAHEPGGHEPARRMASGPQPAPHRRGDLQGARPRLDLATQRDPRVHGVLSTKGTL